MEACGKHKIVAASNLLVTKIKIVNHTCSWRVSEWASERVIELWEWCRRRVGTGSKNSNKAKAHTHMHKSVYPQYLKPLLVDSGYCYALRPSLSCNWSGLWVENRQRWCVCPSVSCLRCKNISFVAFRCFIYFIFQFKFYRSYLCSFFSVVCCSPLVRLEGAPKLCDVLWNQ